MVLGGLQKQPIQQSRCHGLTSPIKQLGPSETCPPEPSGKSGHHAPPRCFGSCRRDRKVFKHQHTRVGMATTNISITQEAYNRLGRERQGNESFSEIINRLTRKKSIMEFAGILSKESADRLEENIRRHREAFDREARKRVERIVKELQKK